MSDGVLAVSSLSSELMSCSSAGGLLADMVLLLFLAVFVRVRR